MRWFRPATQEAAGLTRAHSLDTFPRTGNLTGCNLPVVLHAAQREGLLRDDMLVALHAGAAGTTYSGTLLRWGR
jgi:3-oxoacyl-[acyl-carrier-protein] synthase III